MSVTSCLLLLSVLAWAAREDLLRHRIPNELNLAAMLAAIGLAYSSGGTHGVASSVAGAAVGCAAFAPFYLLRGMGAGDVKLMAAAGAFLGPADALAAAALAIVMGGALAVAVVMLRLVESTPVRGSRCVTVPPRCYACSRRSRLPEKKGFRTRLRLQPAS